MNAGAAKGREEIAVPATTTNTTTNATQGSPPASAVAFATAVTATAVAAAATNNDNNGNDDNNNGVDLDALRRRVRDLHRMLHASADCLAKAEADAAVARVKCARMSELAERRAGERICRVEEELRRTQIEAERFRVGWTRLHAAVGGRGRKRRADGALALSSGVAAAEADDAPPPPGRVGGGGGGPLLPLPPPPAAPRRHRRSSLSQRTRSGIVVGEGGDRNSTVYAGAKSAGS